MNKILFSEEVINIETHTEGSLKLSGSVVAIGAFDGVHQGHQAVIRKAVERSKVLGVPSVVYTFDPPPRLYFQGVRTLTSVKEKLTLIRQLEVDYTVLAKFDEFYISRPPIDFINYLKRLNPLEIIVGSDFRFGKNREGDIHLLETYFNIGVMEPICCSSGKVISSTRIRELLSQGQIQESFALLGR